MRTPPTETLPGASRTKEDNVPAVPAVPAEGVDAAIDRALGFLASEQADSGAWPGDYGGPQFLLPLYVGTCQATGVDIDDATRANMARYILGHQNPDGGWGLHIEGHSQVFTSALNYVAMRLLDVPADDPAAVRALAWLHDHGGPLASAAWGKIFLALLNLYDYRGLNPVPPELWLLPESMPVHPSRMWCHCRMVYLPMSYLYGARVQMAVTPRVEELRRELYGEPYAEIDWNGARDRVAEVDAYAPVSDAMRAINGVLSVYERRPLSGVRQKALDEVLRQVAHEDRNTNYICIGPISKLLHMWVWHDARPGGAEFQAHLEQLPEYLCHAPDGTKMNGYNSSELWDTTFAVQAIAATGKGAEHLGMLTLAERYIEANQVREDVEEREACYRDGSTGGWPFSDRSHGWPISDCTAEGIKASLALSRFLHTDIDCERLTQAVDFLLFLQNDDGGWATYERTRGPRWLEALNPSDCFSEIMIDYSYVECTAACIESMVAFMQRYPGKRDALIVPALNRAETFLRGVQRDDGSFEGSWGVCFTYGAWFGIGGLRALGVSRQDPAVRRAVTFLQGKQQADGGWGETAESNRLRRYVHSEHSQPVMTAWAVLALIAAGEGRSPTVQRGVDFLVRKQAEDGSFPQTQIAGMFNKTCAIHYDNYPKIFPLWALAEYAAI